MEVGVLSVLFPSLCVFCGFSGKYICERCIRGQKIPPPHCFYCGKQSILGLTHPSCIRANGVDGLLSFYRYEGLLVELLHRAKYMGEWVLLKDVLFHALHQHRNVLYWWKRLFNPKLCPVPLHSKKEKQRGFNQSAIISAEVAAMEGLQVARVIRRCINTPPQVSMQRYRDRIQNIRGAFKIVGGPPPNSVILIDDVVTSGSTVRECARVLKRAGVKNILAVSIAKG